MSRQIVHTAGCEARHAAYTAAMAGLGAHYCRTCKGSGEVSFDDDPSPAGVSLSAGFLTFTEPCPDCFEQGKCPRCGEVALHNPMESDEIEDVVCEACGWEAGSTPAPVQPDCDCWLDHMERGL